MQSKVKFLSAGDTALTVEFGDTAGLAQSARVLALDRRLVAAALRGVVETVPTLRSLTVHYRPGETSAAALRAAIAPLCNALDEVVLDGKQWRLPVCYGGDYGPDLDWVAAAAGISAAAAAALHAGIAYHVYMIGFLPGHPYMGDLPEALRLPRRDTPRVAVPAGSVAVATSMTVIYPWESPGGWHILGRTPAPLFDASAATPALLAPGDIVRFEPVSIDDFAVLLRRAELGEWRPDPAVASA